MCRSETNLCQQLPLPLWVPGFELRLSGFCSKPFSPSEPSHWPHSGFYALTALGTHVPQVLTCGDLPHTVLSPPPTLLHLMALVLHMLFFPRVPWIPGSSNPDLWSCCSEIMRTHGTLFFKGIFFFFLICPTLLLRSVFLPCISL